MAATREVAAGTAVEATTDRVRAYVVDTIGEERLEPVTAAAATNESRDEELGEEAATKAAKEKKREKQRRKKQLTSNGERIDLGYKRSSLTSDLA